MIEKLHARKIGPGRFKVSFETEGPTMLFLTKFFQLMSREADVFFRQVVKRQKSAELVKEHAAEDGERAEAARIERREIAERFAELKGSRGKRLKTLRHQLLAEERPICYDSLVIALSHARKDAEFETSKRIRKLADRGVPVSRIAERLGVDRPHVLTIARRHGVKVEPEVLRSRLVETVRGMDSDGLSILQMCNRLKLPESMVRRAAVVAGVLKPADEPVSAGIPPKIYEPGDVEAPRGEVLTEWVRRYVEAGLPVAVIARKLRVSAVTVYAHVKACGVVSPATNQAKMHAKEIAEFARKGASSREIGERLGIPAAVVRKNPAWTANLPAWRKRAGSELAAIEDPHGGIREGVSR
jgi:hypothetical protein